MAFSDKLKLVLGFAIFIAFFLVAAIQNNYTALLFAMLIFIAVVWGVFSSITSIIIGHKSRFWPEVVFQLTDGKVNVKLPPAGKGAVTAYSVKFEMQYSYDGTEYLISEDKLQRAGRLSFGTFQDAQQRLDAFNQGGVVTINPAKPSMVLYSTGISKKQIWVLLVLLILLAVSLATVVLITQLILG